MKELLMGAIGLCFVFAMILGMAPIVYTKKDYERMKKERIQMTEYDALYRAYSYGTITFEELMEELEALKGVSNG